MFKSWLLSLQRSSSSLARSAATRSAPVADTSVGSFVVWWVFIESGSVFLTLCSLFSHTHIHFFFLFPWLVLTPTFLSHPNQLTIVIVQKKVCVKHNSCYLNEMQPCDTHGWFKWDGQWIPHLVLSQSRTHSALLTHRGVYVTQNHCKPAGLCDRCSRDVTDMLVWLCAICRNKVCLSGGQTIPPEELFLNSSRPKETCMEHILL